MSDCVFAVGTVLLKLQCVWPIEVRCPQPMGPVLAPGNISLTVQPGLPG